MCGVTDRAFKGTNRLSFRLTQSDFLCIAVRCWNADDPKAAPAEPEEALLRDFCTLCERPNPGSFADASVLLPAGAFPLLIRILMLSHQAERAVRNTFRESSPDPPQI